MVLRNVPSGSLYVGMTHTWIRDSNFAFNPMPSVPFRAGTVFVVTDNGERPDLYTGP